MVVALHDATLATRRALPLTWTGLPPAGPRQLPGALVHQFGRCGYADRRTGSRAAEAGCLQAAPGEGPKCEKRQRRWCDRMRRRELMLFLGGAVTAARALRAQQKTMPVIGYLGNNSPGVSSPGL